MVRHTSLVLLGLGTFGSALAQQSILVGFSDEAGLEAVLERVNPPPDEVGAFSGGVGATKEPTMFRRPLKVARKATGSGSGRKLGIFDGTGNSPGPTEPAESETELTIGFLRVDFTDEDGLPIYSNNTDIDKEIDALNLLPGVTIAELNGEVKALDFPTNVKEGNVRGSSLQGQIERVLAEAETWGIFEMINITQFWAGGSQEVTPQSDVTICVIDTGYDRGHDDLPDTSDGLTGFTPPGQGGSFGVWDDDGSSHGTHVAGTIGAIGSNNIGVVGVNPDPSKFNFHIGKGLGDNGSGSYAGIIDCIEDCVANGADVISMSLGGSGSTNLMESACEAAYDDGVLVIAAAGNDGPSESYLYPASYPVVMSVASVQRGSGPDTNSFGRASSFTQPNDQVEIAGPGSSVYSTVPNDNYGTKSGTSMATPHVSGIAAWLISLFPKCKANQIRNAMLNSVREPPRAANGWDKVYGHGIVDAGAAYSLLSSAGCVGAGGLSPSDAGEDPSEMGQGGTYQRDIGCTEDHHCYIGASFGPRFCNTDLSPNRCAPGTAPPPSPTASPTPFTPCVGADVKITVEFKTDDWPVESSWTLSQTCGSGFSESSPSYSERFKVHIENYCTSNGEFVLTVNDSYGDGLFEGGYFKVYRDDVEMISAFGVDFGSSTTESFGSCAPVTPSPSKSPVTPIPSTSPSISPTSQPTTSQSPTKSSAPALEATFDIEITAPKCGEISSSCTATSDLLIGTSANDEPNQGDDKSSNTINGCQDGSDGVYGRDESIEWLSIVSVDPDSDSDEPWDQPLKVGGKAKIIAGLHAYRGNNGNDPSQVSNDYADFYFSSQANPPDWKFLDTIQLSGDEVDSDGFGTFTSKSFIIEEGTPMQAIRVDFRYQGDRDDEACTGGQWADTDDLSFFVAPATAPPTSSPTSGSPTTSPTSSPSSTPTVAPSVSPSAGPTTGSPTTSPTPSPSSTPTVAPSVSPSASPTTGSPTTSPTPSPSSKPTVTPSVSPSASPTTRSPTTSSPSRSPTLKPVTDSPSASPSGKPTTGNPSSSPVTRSPSSSPVTPSPSSSPSMKPTTLSPTSQPSRGPSASPTSQPTTSPTSRPTTSSAPALEATFDIDITAPKCGEISSNCTATSDLLIGTAANDEPNQGDDKSSNTIDGCQDGSDGVYGRDESIEWLSIVSVDPDSDSDEPWDQPLKVGGKAKIIAGLHAYMGNSGNDPSDDYADFYFSSEANPPDWKLFDTIQLTRDEVDSGGFGTFTSKSFTIEEGTPIQAIRVDLRYRGGPDDEACTGGQWADTDDLGFFVAPN